MFSLNIINFRRLILPLIVLFLLFANKLFSQSKSADIQFAPQHLSKSAINCMLKDKYGFMWFGTDDGLIKYDGHKIKIYRNDQKKPESIPNNNIRCLLEDRKGNLWVGTDGGGLVQYNRKEDLFYLFENNILSGKLSSKHITSIFEDKAGDLWIGTKNGLDVFEKQSGTLKIYVPNTFKNSSIAPSFWQINLAYILYLIFTVFVLYWAYRRVTSKERFKENELHQENSPFTMAENGIKPMNKLRELSAENLCITSDSRLSEIDVEFMKKAIKIVEENIAESTFDIDYLAGNLRVSRRQLYRKLKIITNQTVHDFITSIRLKKAITFLLSGNYTISEVAYKVGFSEPANFSRCFTREYGKSPKKYMLENLIN